MGPATPGPIVPGSCCTSCAPFDPDRSLLEDLIEIDEATLPFRTAKDPATGGQGRSPQGKMRIAGAVSYRPRANAATSARSLRAFVAGTSAPGARVITDGRLLRPARPRPPAQGRRCNARPSRADVDPSCVLEPSWCAAPICAATSRVRVWNRRRHTATAFDTLLGIGTRLRPADYRDIVGQRG